MTDTTQTAEAVPTGDKIALDINEIQKILPHRYPFLLIDRVIELVRKERIVALKNVTINEPFFAGHFPGAPIMPGVLIIEAIAQALVFAHQAMQAIGAEDPLLGIPTTYYAAVQLSGPVTVVDDPAGLAAILRRQLASAQPGVAVATPEATHASRLPSIRGLRLHIEQVRAKFKYGGNVDAAHRQAVAERLAARNGPGDAAAAAHTLRRLA